MFISEIFAKVINLFQDKSRFHQGYYQVDVDGKKCTWAVGHCFCVLGAIGHFTWPFGFDSHPATCCLQRVSEHLFEGRIIQDINDNEGLEKVLEALEFARKLWEGREPTEEDLGRQVKELPWLGLPI